jgi:hypothetical protein
LIVAIPARTGPKITERRTTITRDDDAFSDSVRILALQRRRAAIFIRNISTFLSFGEYFFET